MKTFVINLDKNIDRLASMDAQLKRLGIEYERIPAVYGASLTKEERKKYFSAFRSFCASGYRLSNGALGCALSHGSVYKRMMNQGIQCALVFEDDIRISEHFADTISQIENIKDCNKAQVFLLSTLTDKEARNCTIERVGNGQCADGYVITLPAARKVWKSNFPVITVADAWHRWIRRSGIELYQCNPPVVRQQNEMFASDINRFVNNKAKERRAYWIARIMRPVRALELLVDYCMYLLTKR